MRQIAGSRRVLLLAFALLAFFLRVYRLDAPALRGDEAFSVLLARDAPGDMLRTFVASTEPHPPLSFLLLHYWGRVAGESEFALRFTSLWFGVLAVPLIYALGSRLWDHRVGLAAAGLLAANPFYIWHAQEARMYAILAALTLASTLLYLMVLDRREWYWWAAYGLASALSIYTHYYAFLVIAFHGLYAVLYAVLWSDRGTGRRILSLIRWGAGLALTGALYLPWLLSTWRVLTAYHGNARSELPFFAPVYRCLLVFGQGQTLPERASLWFLPLWGGLFLGGLVVAWRRRRSGAVMMLLYLLIPWTIVFADSLQRPAFDERYFMVSTPPYYLFIALSLVTLLDLRRAARVMPAIVVSLILGVCGVSLYNYYHDPAYARAPDWRALTDYFSRHTRAGDVVIQNYPDPAASYYYDFDAPWIVLPESFPVDREATGHKLDELVGGYSRIWLTPQVWRFWDDQGLVEHWLNEHTERVFETQVDRFTVLLYHTPRQYVQELVPLDVRLGKDIRLVGYVVRDDLGQAVDKVEIGPEEQIRLTLYWQASASVGEDYVVFVHLLDGMGWLRGQQDNQPRRGTFPTKAWVPGELVVDTYQVPVAADAPPGDYAVEIGMYRPVDGTRLTVSGADGEPEQRRVLLQNRVRVQ